MLRKLLFTAAILAAPCAAAAQDLSPAIIYDIGGRFDKSFNQSAYEGVLRFETDRGIPVEGVELQPSDDRRVVLERVASGEANFVIALGFSFSDALNATAAAHPDDRFVSIDSVVEGPNVASFVFKEHEGSYLAGVAAAMASEKGALGFVGGLDIPIIRRFHSGFALGARSINPDIRILSLYMDQSAAPFDDPFGGGQAAMALVDDGADVLYAAAGLTGLGVLQVAHLEGVYAVGVDSNQNYLYPGVMLTSMVKRVGFAVERALNAAADREWRSGVEALGLAEGGVDVAIDQDNAQTLTDPMRAAVEKARAAIVSGSVTVAERVDD